MIKYYLDTSIWMDVYEDRKGFNDEPLGKCALKLLSLIRVNKNKLIITDRLIRELERYYSLERINGMIKPFENLIEKIISTKKQHNEAKKIAKERNVPAADVLHSVIARDYCLVLVTRDKHFKDVPGLLVLDF